MKQKLFEYVSISRLSQEAATTRVHPSRLVSFYFCAASSYLLTSTMLIVFWADSTARRRNAVARSKLVFVLFLERRRENKEFPSPLMQPRFNKLSTFLHLMLSERFTLFVCVLLAAINNVGRKLLWNSISSYYATQRFTFFFCFFVFQETGWTSTFIITKRWTTMRVMWRLNTAGAVEAPVQIPLRPMSTCSFTATGNHSD